MAALLNQRVVLDTNILVSAMLSRQGNSARIVDLALDKRLTFVYSTGIISEYEKVLFRKKFNFDSTLVRIIIRTLQHNGFCLEPKMSGIPFVDETDRIFYDTAVSGKAVLITGNGKHFPRKSFIVAPADFVEN